MSLDVVLLFVVRYCRPLAVVCSLLLVVVRCVCSLLVVVDGCLVCVVACHAL